MQKRHPRLTTMLALAALIAALSGGLANAGDPDVPQTTTKRLRPTASFDGGGGKGLVGWRGFPVKGKIWTIWFLSRWFPN